MQGLLRVGLPLSCSLSLSACRSSAGSVPIGKAEDVGLSTERLKRIGEAVQRHITAGNVAGAVTLVARRGKIAHFEAQGVMDVDTKKPMAKDNLFRLASMSKPITGVAVMMLVEEGKIRLNDPVSRFIPEFANLNKVAVPRPGHAGRRRRREGRDGPAPYDVVSANRQITIADLLKHGSGLVSGGLGAADASRLAPRTPTDTLATYIPKLAAVPLDFQPGTLWRYSGQAGFDVLSRVVEVVSGQTYDKFLQERLLGPLGMPDTGFFAPASKASRVVTMSETTPNGLRAVARTDSTVYFSGAGGMMSTAEDYLQFAQMMVNGGELNGRRYLSPQTMALDDVEPYGRHGERSVRPAAAWHGVRAEHAGRDGSSRRRSSRLEGRVRLGGRHGRQLLGRAGRADWCRSTSSRAGPAASCAATSRTRFGRRSSIEC